MSELVSFISLFKYHCAFNKSAFNCGIESVVAKIIVRNIGERGTKARPFIAPTLNQKRLDTLSQSIADHLASKIFT